MRMVTFYIDDETRESARIAAMINAGPKGQRNVAEFYRTAIAREARRVIERHERKATAREGGTIKRPRD